MIFTKRTRSRTVRRLACGGVVAALSLLGGCGDEPELSAQTLPAQVSATIPAYDVTAGIPVGAAALALIPADATAITVTDFDQVRAALGVPELTGQSPLRDRLDFWERARRESVLLTGGMLLDDGSKLSTDQGFTQDDVDWEAHFTTAAGEGWILGFRPDLDMSFVQSAVGQGVAGLAGGVVDPAQHLVSMGAVPAEAASDVDTWGTIEGITELTSPAPAESIYYSAGCVPLEAALGPDADLQDQEDVVSAHDPTDLAPLAGFSVSFADGLATARLGPDRTDLFRRADLAADFPTSGPIGFGDGFKDPVVDPSTGRIGYTVVATVPAATATLTDLLPFAVCNEVAAVQEPTSPSS